MLQRISPMDRISIVATSKSRLDVMLQEALGSDPKFTRSYIKRLIEEGAVIVNGTPVKKAGFSVADQQLVEVELPTPVEVEVVPQNIPIDIVYEDSDLIVINKQRGISVHPSDTELDGTLVNALMYHVSDLSSINGVKRPGIVHRIDKNTTGLLVVAKNDKAHLSLSSQIAEKTAQRYYYALVDGNIKEEEGRVDFALGRDKKNRLRMARDDNGKVSLTNYYVKERFMQYTLVECHLQTGRTHQIRAHMRGINHPIVGDVLYSGSNKFGLDGQLLHAFSLSFSHPTTGEAMTFLAPIPEDFSRVLNLLRHKA